MGAGVPYDGTSALVVVAVLTTYVVLSAIVEFCLHKVHHLLEHRKRNKALLEVFEKVKDEIMLVGVLTIVLLLVEERIAEDVCIDSICHGIPNLKPACDPYADIRDVSNSSSSSSSSGSRRMLLGSSSGSSPTCDRYSDCCSRGTGFSSSCPSGQQNFASIKALHDIHYYILILMLCHIFMTVMVMWGSSKRVQSWEIYETNDKMGKQLAPRKHKGICKIFCSCQKQFHESVDHFTYVAIKNYFIARNKKYVEAQPQFTFFNELMEDVSSEYIQITGVSFWMWLVLSVQTVIKAYVYEAAWGTYLSILLIVVAGSKLDTIKADICSDIFDVADENKDGKMDEKEFAKLSKVEGDMLNKLQQLEPEFWFRSPSIVLLMIRMVIWLNSTEIGTTVFHMLGSFDNCYVKRRTWLWIGINTGLTLIVALHCSLNVIPLYSLTSNLGSHQEEVSRKSSFHQSLATAMGSRSHHEKSSKIQPTSAVEHH